MEKYSAYRDPGTGIQPFLPPIPSTENAWLTRCLVPLAHVIGILRLVLLFLLTLIYFILVYGVCHVLAPIPPLYHIATNIITAVICRGALFIIGFFFISVTHVSRNRGRQTNDVQTWKPKAGDIIVSNSVSWIELLWLAFRFNPIFLLPIAEGKPASKIPLSPDKSFGRRTGTGSASIERNVATNRIPIAGFRPISLLTMIRTSGRVPDTLGGFQTLEDIRGSADRPVVVFPECTTSNGRGLLRFANVLHQKVPVKKYEVFVMCVRYDPPTALRPALSHSIPSRLNPLAHLYAVACSLTLPAISIRLLAPSESPGSPIFIASELIHGSPEQDELMESCASLIAQIGKIKQTGLGWEEKAKFLNFYHTQQHS